MKALRNKLQARRVSFRQEIFTKAKCQGTFGVGSFGQMTRESQRKR
jgi:hypothetical protein